MSTRIAFEQIPKTKFCTWYFFVLISATFVTSGLFISKSFTPLFSYLFSITLLAVLIGSINLFKLNHTFRISTPVFLTILWGIFVIFHGAVFSGGFNLHHVYLLSNIALFLFCYVLSHFSSYNVSKVYRSIVIIGVIESLICITQYFRWTGSLNAYFPVTGTSENPNITAMYLSMAVPAVFLSMSNKKQIIRQLSFLCIILFIGIIMMLKCRTALVGAVCALATVIFMKYNVIGWFTNRKSRSAAVLCTAIGLAILLSVSQCLYQSKKASADGRKLIWKISTKMIFENPLKGYGYGAFERNYNLFQADYFKKGDASSDEIFNGSFVRMGYNEFLQNGVEGGLLGLVIFSWVIISLLLAANKVRKAGKTQDGTGKLTNVGKDHTYFVACAGLVSFIVMSLFNFTIQAIPVMCLFVLYSAHLATYQGLNLFSVTSPFVKGIKVVFSIALIIGGSYGLLNYTELTHANYLNKQAKLNFSIGEKDTALNILFRLKETLNTYESYWTNYGSLLLEILMNQTT